MTDAEKLDLILAKMENFATKDDLAEFAKKDDLAAFATKDDLAAFATKEDLDAKMANFATKTDLRNEINLVLGELDSTEDRINRKFKSVDKKIHELNVKIETLRYSNEAIEILMKRQDLMDLRLQKVEKKVSYL